MTVVIFLLITVILWGTTPIIEKLGLNTGISPFMAMTIRSFAVSAVLLVILAVTGKIKEVFAVDAKTIAVFSISGILAGLVGMWTYFYVLQRVATSKIVPISATYPLVAAFLSVVILKEQFSLLRILGTAFIVLGIWLVK